MNRPRLAAALPLLLALVACADAEPPPAAASASVGAGAGGSGPVDAGVGGADAGVEPSGNDCPDTEVHEGRVCVPEGWFVLSRWSTGHAPAFTPGPQAFGPEPTQRVYLDAYRIDEHEVTHGRYAAFVQASGAAPLPDTCGYETFKHWADPQAGSTNQVSGWTGGAPAAELLDHPVVCVTRTEAAAFCAWAGGRLPTVAEWMKAGRGPEPDARRHPWGDEPPSFDGPFADTSWIEGRVVVGADGPALQTKPVYWDHLGRSPRGVLGLAGNVSELLATCLEDLPNVYPDQPALVRPKEGVKAACESAILFGGSHWHSRGHTHAMGAQFIFWTALGKAMNYAGVGEHMEPPWAGSLMDGSGLKPEDGAGSDPAGNDRREWLVGFRCAYPLE